MHRAIAIDGACRGNGTPGCIAAGSCFIIESDASTTQAKSLAACEVGSTSQRGELLGLLQASEYVCRNPADTVIVTDSEYMFNTVRKEWVPRWIANGWATSMGEPVRNKDLWLQIYNFLQQAGDLVDVVHIKGHLLSAGKVTAKKLMQQDKTGFALYQWVLSNKQISMQNLQHARDLSTKNNGYCFGDDMFYEFGSMNLVADTLANLEVEREAEAQWQAMINP